MVPLVALLLLAAVLVYLGYPLFAAPGTRPASDTAMDGSLSSPAREQEARLLSEREAVLETLRDLDFDRGIGNLSEEDYADLAGLHRRKAVALMRALDAELAGAVPAGRDAGARAAGETESAGEPRPATGSRRPGGGENDSVHVESRVDASRPVDIGGEAEARIEADIARARRRLAAGNTIVTDVSGAGGAEGAGPEGQDR